MKLTVTLELEFIGGRRKVERDELLSEICHGAQTALADVTGASQTGGKVLSHAFAEAPSRKVAG